MRCRLVSCVLGLTAVFVQPSGASAEDYFTLVVSGASGDPRYVETYDRWRQTLIASLRSRPEFREEHLLVLADTPGPGIGRASREGVHRAFDQLRARMTDDSVASIVLFGHGTFDGVDAKFNLVGPDLGADEWRGLIETLPGQVVFVNTTAASFPFLSRVAGPRRVVVTATESSAQQYDHDVSGVSRPGVRDGGRRHRSERTALGAGGLRVRERGGSPVVSTAGTARNGAGATRRHG